MQRGNGDGRGNLRFRVSDDSRMATRHTRNNEDEVSERDRMIDKFLQDANIPLDISQQEKYDLYAALQASNDVNVVEQTQRLTLNLRSPDTQRSPDSHQDDDFQKASTSQGSEDIFEDVEEPQPIRSVLEQKKQMSHFNTPVRDEDNPKKVTRQSSGTAGRGLPERGRGRAIPKVMYNPLPITSPGQRSNTPQTRPPGSTSISSPSSQCDSSGTPNFVGTSSIEDYPLSPQDTNPIEEEIFSDTRQSNQRKVHIPEHEGSSSDQSSPLHAGSCPGAERVEPQEMLLGPLSPDSSKNKFNDDESEAVDVESDEEEGKAGSIRAEQANSPASVEDAADEDEKESHEVKLVGNVKCTVSPLHSMTRSFPSHSSFKFFEELEKFKENEEEYMTHARELGQACRLAVLERIFVENPLWGPPITDGGYNKQTLFKQSLPKYSKILTNSSDKQGGATIRTSERAAKAQAVTKIQEMTNEINSSESDFYGSRQRSKVKNEECGTPEFHSLRQRSRQFKAHDASEDKMMHQSNVWGSRKKTDVDSKDEVECLDASAPDGVSENWQSERDQKRLDDSDSETSPEPLTPSGGIDCYDYDESADHDEPGVFVSKQNRNKRNNKRGGQSLQGDCDVEAKSFPRPRGGQNPRGRSTKLRLQNKSIAHPSEHATSSNKSKNKSSVPGQGDGDIMSQNNVNAENRWIHVEPKDSRNSNISTSQFYGNNKVIQPRTTMTPQPRKAPRESQAHSGFPSSPVSSGSHYGLDHDDKNDAAAAATAECPICNKMFLQKDIVAHSSDCFEFSSNAVGEESADVMKDSINSDKTVSEDIEDPGSPTATGSDESLLIQCKKCKVNLNPRSMRLHQEKCENVLSQSGLKRANSIEDDGPAKKASRRLD